MRTVRGWGGGMIAMNGLIEAESIVMLAVSL